MPVMGRRFRGFHTFSIKRGWNSAGAVDRGTCARGDFWPWTAPTDLVDPFLLPHGCPPVLALSISSAETAVPTCDHVRATPQEWQWAGAVAAFGRGGGYFHAGCHCHCQGGQAAVAKEACRDGILHSGASEGWWVSNLGPGGPGLCQVLTL